MTAKIVAAALECGDEPPPLALAELWPVCLPYMTAWTRLNQSREVNVGMGAAIPVGLKYSEVIAYAKANGFDDPDELPLFIELVYVLDDVFLKYAREKK